MKIIAFDRFKPNVTMETITPLPLESLFNPSVDAAEPFDRTIGQT